MDYFVSQTQLSIITGQQTISRVLSSLRHRTCAMRHAVIASLLLLLTSPVVAAQAQFLRLEPQIIQDRLKAFGKSNADRETGLKNLFDQVGCRGPNLTEQSIKAKLPPNLICTLPGQTADIIVVGAHFDHVEIGDGVVDNWSGASLLPSLYQSLAATPRKHTFVFIGFTEEEKGLKGSLYYVEHIKREELSRIKTMINMDSLGLNHTEVWASKADPLLLGMLLNLADRMKLPISGVNVDQVGTSDSEPFGDAKIPRLTLHSVTQKTLPILHSKHDNLDQIQLDAYYDSYRLITGYLAFLDTYLEQAQAETAEKSKSNSKH
jgi:hypothetical protein